MITGPRDDEKQFLRRLSSKGEEVDKPEIAVEFARLLIAHGRLQDAKLIVFAALDEGPRYDLYELRAASAHSNLEELWDEIHKKLGVTPEKDAATIYNEGLRTHAPDWKEVLKNLSGN